MICLTRFKVQAAHIRAGSGKHGKRDVGMREKPDDDWTLPLCEEHHLFGHDSQHDMNELAFWKTVGKGIDPFTTASAIRLASGDVERAEMIIKEARENFNG